jgi:tetratricopeptide (TPR) repeat protein
VRQLRLITLISACALSAAASLHGASYAEVRERIHPGEQSVQDVRLDDVLAMPDRFLNTRLRCRVTFAKVGNLFDTQHTFYKPYTHANILVWGERAALWDPRVRADGLALLYISKDRPDASHLGEFTKFQVVEILGEVAMMAGNVPCISVHEIHAIDTTGQFSDTSIYHAEQATKLNGEGAYDLAEDHFAAALSESIPTSARVSLGFKRGANLLAGGQFAKCVTVMTEALALAAQDPTIDRRELASMHYLMAKAKVEINGADPDAVAHARRAVELDPEQGDAYAVLGVTLAGAGQFDESRRQCEKAIRLRPGNAEVRWYLGRILDQQGAYDDSVDALRKAIDITPKDGRLHRALATTYFHRAQKTPATAAADLAMAYTEYQIAVRLNAADADALVGAAQVLEFGADHKVAFVAGPNGTKVAPGPSAALERYKAAIVANPACIPARKALAAAADAAQKPDEAVGHYQALADAQPTDVAAASDLAGYLTKVGRKDEAYAALQQFVSKNPTSVPGKLAAAAASVDAGKPVEGIALVEPVVDADSANGAAWLVLAKCQLAAGQAKDARKSAGKAEDRLTDPVAKAQAQQVRADAEAAASK